MKASDPDSKQSWLVVLASCVIKFMTYGPTEVAGMLMVYTMYTFDSSRESASLPYTLVYTIRNGSGPLIAYVGNIIGLRSTTLIGCVLSSMAIGACFFAESVMTVTILWGIVFGFGFAFEGLLLNSITMEHFKTNLSKALAVTNAGAVLGICCFSPYLDFLVNSFGLSGAFLLLAGATLHSIPAALFILLNKPQKHSKPYTNKTICASDDRNEIHLNVNKLKRSEDFDVTSNCKDSTLNSLQQYNISNEKLRAHDQNSCTNSIHSENIQTICNDTEKPVKIVTYKVCGTDAFVMNWNKTDQWIDIPLKSEKIEIEQKYGGHVDFASEKTMSICSNSNSIEPQLRNATQTFKAAEKLRTNNVLEKLPTHQLMKILFSHPIYWLILICNGMHYFTLPAFFTLLVDYAIDIGMDPVYSKYLVIYSQCVEFVGCLVLGWLADLKLITSNGFAVILFLCQSMALALMPWAQNIIFLALVVLVFQWTQTGISLIYPSVVSDSLEKEIRPSALASMFILAAPLDLSISPLIGYFRDKKGSYTGVYLTLALAAFIGCLSQMCISKCVNRRKQSTETGQTHLIP